MIYRVFFLIIFATFTVEAQQAFSDVQATDPAYSAIEASINKGYFTTVEGSKFLPNQSVSRKELAVIINRIENLTTKASLSNSEIVELKEFSNQFKSFLETQYNQKELVDSEVSLIKTEQKTLNYDISRLEENVQQVEKNRKEQEIYIWLGLGLGILGVLK